MVVWSFAFASHVRFLFGSGEGAFFPLECIEEFILPLVLSDIHLSSLTHSLFFCVGVLYIKRFYITRREENEENLKKTRNYNFLKHATQNVAGNMLVSKSLFRAPRNGVATVHHAVSWKHETSPQQD